MLGSAGGRGDEGMESNNCSVLIDDVDAVRNDNGV